jgi:hypothetical protein
MFVDFKVPGMRLVAILSHFLLTTGLYWTKFDSIQVAMEDYRSDHEYKVMNQQYVGLVSFSLISLVFQMVVLSVAPDQITLATMLHLGADCAACFWISWIILDGLDWYTYVYIFVFCVILPTTYDLIELFAHLVRKPSRTWRKNESVLTWFLSMYQRAHYRLSRLWS